MLLNRVLSFSIIISLGFLLIASLIVNGLILALSDQLSQYFPDLTILAINIFNFGSYLHNYLSPLCNNF